MVYLVVLQYCCKGYKPLLNGVRLGKTPFKKGDKTIERVTYPWKCIDSPKAATITHHVLCIYLPLQPCRPKQCFCKQCRSWRDGSIWAVSSRATLFAILFWFLTETPIWNIGTGKIQTWKSLFQKLKCERIEILFPSLNYMLTSVYNVYPYVIRFIYHHENMPI